MSFRSEPIPFEKIAVAVTLSPSIHELVGEGFYFARKFNSKLYFIHIGEDSHQAHLLDIIKQHNELNQEYEFIIKHGDIVDTLLEVTKEHHVDLLIAGALQKESPWKYILGSVSRSICRKAKCSLLMIKEPHHKTSGFNKLVVNCIDNPKTPFTIDAAIYVANHLTVSDLTLVKEDQLSNVSSLAEESCCEDEILLKKRQQVQEEQNQFNDISSQHQFEDINVKFKMLKGKPGKEISNFARTQEADLLIVNSPDQEFGLLHRFFPHGLEHALEDLPCSLMIIHSRIQTTNA